MEGVQGSLVEVGNALALASLVIVLFIFLFVPSYLRECPTLVKKCENSGKRNKAKEKNKKKGVNKERIHLSFACKVLGWGMKLRYKSFATTTLWGKAQEGSRTAIKAIKKRLRSLVVERERDPLINRPEIAAGYKIISLGKLENTQAQLNLDA